MKNNMMKKLLTLVLAGAMTLSLAACGATDTPSADQPDNSTEEAKTYKVAVIKQLDHASLDEIANAVAAELDQLAQTEGVKIEYEITSGQGDQTILKQLACEGFVNGVIDDLIDEVVQTARGGRADVHARALAHRFQSLEDLNFRGVVIVVGIDRRGLQKFVVCHGVLLSVQGTKNWAGTASDAFLRTLYSIFGWEGRLHRGLSFCRRKKVHAIHERFTQHAQKHNACERRKVERRALAVDLPEHLARKPAKRRYL